MYYGALKKTDTANGLGVRVTLFVSGCNHRCKGCFNANAWDFKYGKEFTEETIDEILEALNKDYISGITVLGGDPFEPSNQEGVLPLIRRIKKELPNKSIWFFSGYYFDKEILGKMCKESEITKELISYIDVMVDGRFEIDKLDITLRFRGSSNQRIINVKESLNQDKVILCEEYMK